ncbi:MAG: DUF4286 family protein [Crocinitomicaceae bacterium]|jgi:hypothetical protein
MILYNVTVSIDPGVQTEWLEWMRITHIPDMMATGCFLESRICRVHGEEEGGVTFAIGYVAPSQEKYDEYLAAHSEALQEAHGTKFNGKFAAFRTILTVLEEYKK